MNTENLKSIFIDGRSYLVKADKSVLEIAQEEGIAIPSLCSHANLSPYGACRLCLVEVDNSRLEAACTLRPQEAMQISTTSEKVIQSRQFTIAFLLQRAPDCRQLQAYAKEYAVMTSSAKSILGAVREFEIHCIQCGMCVRACSKYGSETLQFVGKGSKRKVLLVDEKTCIFCDACKKYCPTDAIEIIHTQSGVQQEVGR